MQSKRSRLLTKDPKATGSYSITIIPGECLSLLNCERFVNGEIRSDPANTPFYALKTGFGLNKNNSGFFRPYFASISGEIVLNKHRFKISTKTISRKNSSNQGSLNLHYTNKSSHTPAEQINAVQNQTNRLYINGNPATKNYLNTTMDWEN